MHGEGIKKHAVEVEIFLLDSTAYNLSNQMNAHYYMHSTFLYLKQAQSKISSRLKEL